MVKTIALFLIFISGGHWVSRWETHWGERPTFVHWYDYECSNNNVIAGIKVVRIGFHREYEAYVMGDWGLDTDNFDEAQQYIERKAHCV